MTTTTTVDRRNGAMDTVSVLQRKTSSLSMGHDQHEQLRINFRLPATEQLHAEIPADCSAPQLPSTTGKLFLSTKNMCYAASDMRCVFVLPLCAVRRVERIHHRHTAFAIAVTAWHNTTLQIALLGLRYAAEQFCDALKTRLKAQSSSLSHLQPFLATCWSEYLLERKDTQPPGGLGIVYGFPGNAKRQRDKAKIRLWAEYCRDNGRNLTLIRVPTFQKLVRVGLPNRLRGEVWELCSGSMYSRFFSSATYQQLLSQNATNQSIALEEIEKDLSRSLPEYPAYQTEEGIERLRRNWAIVKR
ncbi:GTPase-activating protein GYP2 [Neolecta irregularis DAH-3]|uniref:GTPase-activating protein GYP2 n=1 Tax=Neolecta irregularis (strain DAH-3) TaxID=1198029 RepID=A0A1U7LPH4_NEOID|nr:GTPase-activating protein GYP2 [Neolecta irregularis DAH-3]|eukprot:OLL24555.1 GTPase-activating protein GYP2 [Neolecta irregularis DAH-3]